jgi:UDP-2-acetamido-3-amino-2,3-dideoxy-glucuronate N-acetyltransferase
MPKMSSPWIDSKAKVETEYIGPNTDICAFAWIMKNSRIGVNCLICGFATVDEDVIIEDDVSVMNGAYVARGARVLRGSFIGPNAVITDDKYPRSPRAPEYRFRYGSIERWHRATKIGPFASLGANATVIAGCDVGAYALVGAGAVVTHPVPERAQVIGVPARIIGFVDEARGAGDKAL